MSLKCDHCGGGEDSTGLGWPTPHCCQDCGEKRKKQAPAKRWLCGEISLGKLIELSGLKTCHAQAADFAGGIANAMNEQLQAAIDRNKQLATENCGLREDKEMLDWLEKHLSELIVDTDTLIPPKWFITWPHHRILTTRRDTLRQAIRDAQKELP